MKPVDRKGLVDGLFKGQAQLGNKNKAYDARQGLHGPVRHRRADDVANSIQTMLLLDETPIMIPCFYDFLTGVRKGISGVETTGMAHIQLTGAGQTA